MFERFTDKARRVVVLSQEEARMLNHDWIGTEHILLGLLREGDGVGAQVLVSFGLDLNRVRQQVLQLLHGHPGEPLPASAPGRPDVVSRLASFAARLDAIERRLRQSPSG